MEVEEDEEEGHDDVGQLDLESKEPTEDHGNNYVAQLRQVFMSCDTSGNGQLSRTELIELCSQLHLEDQAGLIVDHLLGDEPDAKVDFDDFKDKFVFLLAQSVSESDVVSTTDEIVDLDKEKPTFSDGPKIIRDKKNNFKSPEREVSPRYVWGSKKYGRRSRPDIDSDAVDTNYLLNSDSSDQEEVFLFDSNDDGLSSAVEDDRLSLESHQLDSRTTTNQQKEHRRSSLSHQTQQDTSVSPSLYHSLPPAVNSHRQGAKRRRRMRSSEDRSSLESNSQEDQQADLCKWTADVGQQDNPSNGPSGGTDEEYLQSIWVKLKVGSDGFLNKDGLIRVCEHIGMEKLSEEIVSQLFEKLDVDQDGQISFDEFLHLFRNGEAASTTNNSLLLALDIKVGAPECQRPSTVEPLAPNTTSTSSSTSIKSFNSDIGIFHTISSECIRPGYVEPEVIVELWESLGITSGYTILRHMGMNSCNPISLSNLTSALEDALQSPRTTSRDSEVCQAAIATYNQQIKFLRKTIEQMVIEREKLRGDVAEANSRATLMAQEVDDHQIKLENSSQMKITNIEKKYQEQIRRLQEDLEGEREVFNAQLSIDKQSLEDEIASLKEIEAKLRDQMAVAKNENRNLEDEIRELTQQLAEAQKLNQHHQMEAESIMAYKAELTYEEQLREMSMELESVRLENKQLKDNNDELSTELENLRQQYHQQLSSNGNNKGSGGAIISNENYMTTNEEDIVDIGQQQNNSRTQASLHHRRNGSWLSDYIKDQHVTKRRGSGQQNSSTELKTVTMVEMVNCNDVPPLIGHHNDSGLASDNSNSTVETTTQTNERERKYSPTFQAFNFSDDEEYLQLNSQTRGVTEGDRITFNAVTNKVKIKKVFEVLKKRFVEMYLDEINTSQVPEPHDTDNSTLIIDDFPINSTSAEARHRLQRMDALSQIENDDIENNFTEFTNPAQQISVGLLMPVVNNSIKTPDSGIEIAPLLSGGAANPMLKNIVRGEDGWWNRSVETNDEDDENKSQSGGLKVNLAAPNTLAEQSGQQHAMEQRWKSTLERERATWRTVMRDMEEQCEVMRNSQARNEMAFKMDILKNEVYWREQVERERTELEQEKVDLQEKVLSLEFQLANAMKMVRERDVEKLNCRLDEESDDGIFRAAKYKSGNNYLGRSRSWKEHGAGCSNVERRRRPWLRSKNNLEALDIEAEFLEGRNGHDSDASDEDEDYQYSRKNFHDMKTRSQLQQQHDKRKINPKLFEKLILDRGTPNGSGKSNCVIDMNILHSINQHLNQQEKRGRQLEATLKARTTQSEKVLRDTRKGYEDEIQRLTQLIHRTRSFLKEQTIRVKEQEEKLFHADNFIKELSWENAELIKLVQTLEEKRLKSEKLNYGLKQKCEALNQLVADMYRIQTT